MAFAYYIDGQGYTGDERYVYGRFTDADGSTGGNIVTGLNHVRSAVIQTTGSAVSADQTAINETFPNAPGTLTIVCTANTNGIWRAWGH